MNKRTLCYGKSIETLGRNDDQTHDLFLETGARAQKCHELPHEAYLVLLYFIRKFSSCFCSNVLQLAIIMAMHTYAQVRVQALFLAYFSYSIFFSNRMCLCCFVPIPVDSTVLGRVKGISHHILYEYYVNA